MIKTIQFLKKVFGFRKYLSYVNAGLNAVQSLRRDLWLINQGKKVELLDEDNDGKYDLLETPEEVYN